MQHEKYRGRLTVILVVLFMGLYGIFQEPWKLFDSSIPWGQKTSLKPGIDIKGGISLLYEIKAPPGNTEQNLAEKVADSLKKRVDPDGVKNLVWRPQGATKLEIQMPLGQNAEETKKAQEAFRVAQEALSKTNLRKGDVTAALSIPDAAQRQKKLDELAQGYPQRQELLKKITVAYDKYQAAVKDKAETSEAILARSQTKRDYQEVLSKIDNAGDPSSTNISINTLNATLTSYQEKIDKLRGGNEAQVKKLLDERNKKIDEIRQSSKDFPARLAAINEYVTRHDEYVKAKGGVDDAEELKRLLVGSGVLEFHILYDPTTATAEDRTIAEKMKEDLKTKGPYARDMANNTLRFFEVDRPDEFHGQKELLLPYQDKLYVLCYITDDTSMTHKPGQKEWGLADASRSYDQNNRSVVSFSFDAVGASMFGELSGHNLKRQLAIVLDNKLISAPTLQSRIDQNGQISGDFSDADIDYLVKTLRAGSLPARLTDKPIRERLISPSLGAENLSKGLKSCYIGLVVVAIFLIGYYYLMGSVAMVAVLMNLLIILGVLSLFGATFTLPGIAGLVLTLGSAVDANVLIFERLREEELHGLSLKLSIRNAYERALSAILDSNAITIITSVVLYYFGSEEVKGFGLTLLIGIACSLFTALFVTRFIFDYLLDRWQLKSFGSLPLTFPKWQKMLHPNIDWIGKAWFFVALSAVILISGIAAFFTEGPKMYDIEFAKGTSVQFELTKPMSQPQVVDLLTSKIPDHEAVLPSLQVVAVGSAALETEFEAVTPNENSDQVKAAVANALGNLIKADVRATFRGSDKPFTEAQDSQIIRPIDDELIKQYTDAQSTLESNKGGMAIILSNLQPPLSPKDIGERLERARLQANLPYHKFEVESVRNPEAKSDEDRSILIMTSDEDFAYPDGRWTTQLAQPTWGLAVEAITNPSQFKNVSRFDAQVAASTRWDATWALIISVVLVMIYIWLRFGNVKYASATVVAMLHDVVIVVGAIGLSHYLGRTWIGQHVLMIEPFRINLTMVAAVLTVMAYSMVDTLVDFDRIRENRGKVGYVSRQVINDSINQTLSRTLLTVGITMAMVFIMYVFGGAGIHGFTFALLVGILVGSYSSIAIAAPILLFGGKEAKTDLAVRATPAAKLQKVAH
jgi:SecD/SecF fusion protein